MAVVDDCGRCDVAGGLHEGGKEDRRKQEARGQGRLRQGITTPGTGTTSPTCTRTGTTSPRARSYPHSSLGSYGHVCFGFGAVLEGVLIVLGTLLERFRNFALLPCRGCGWFWGGGDPDASTEFHQER